MFDLPEHVFSAWPAKTALMPVFPDSTYAYVRIISGVFITLGVAFILPVASLIAFDLLLWIWRQSVRHYTSAERHAMRRR